MIFNFIMELVFVAPKDKIRLIRKMDKTNLDSSLVIKLTNSTLSTLQPKFLLINALSFISFMHIALNKLSFNTCNNGTA
jgi:hypothetical protein